MNTDIRVSTTFFMHAKIVKLERRLGADAVLSLVKLWIYTAQHREKGVLHDMSEEDIAIAAGWQGDDAKFIAELLDLRLLDSGSEGYEIHNWRKHNPYAAFSEVRSEAGRKGAAARWNKGKNADRIENDGNRIENDGNRIENDGNRNAPAPAPAPAPKDNPPRVERGVGESPGARPKSNGGSRPPPRKGVEIFPDCPDWLPPAQWRDYLDHRRSKRKPLTPAAARIVLQDLDQARSFGHDPTALIRESIHAGWDRCVFPDKHFQPVAAAPTATGAPGGRRKGQTLIEHMYESHARLDARLAAAQNAAGARPALEAELVEDIFHVH